MNYVTAERIPWNESLETDTVKPPAGSQSESPCEMTRSGFKAIVARSTQRASQLSDCVFNATSLTVSRIRCLMGFGTLSQMLIASSPIAPD